VILFSFFITILLYKQIHVLLFFLMHHAATNFYSTARTLP